MFESTLDLHLARMHKDLTAVSDRALDSARQKLRDMDTRLSTVDRRLEVCLSPNSTLLAAPCSLQRAVRAGSKLRLPQLSLPVPARLPPTQSASVCRHPVREVHPCHGRGSAGAIAASETEPSGAVSSRRCGCFSLSCLVVARSPWLRVGSVAPTPTPTRGHWHIHIGGGWVGHAILALLGT